MSLPQLVVDGDIEKFRYGLRQLIQNTIDGQKLYDYTALMLACQTGQIEIVRLLLEQEVNVNLQSRGGDTALMFACKQGYTEIVQLLMQRKDIDVNLQGQHNDTALIMACSQGYTEIVQLLMQREDIDVHLRGRYNYTALICVCNRGEIETLNLFAEALKMKFTISEPKYTPEEYQLFDSIDNEITKRSIFEHLHLNSRSIQEQAHKFLIYKYFACCCLGIPLSGQPSDPSESSEASATKRRRLARSIHTMNTKGKGKQKNLGQAFKRLSMELLREISEYLSWEDYSTRKPIDVLLRNLFLLEEFKGFAKDEKTKEKISAVLRMKENEYGGMEVQM